MTALDVWARLLHATADFTDAAVRSCRPSSRRLGSMFRVCAEWVDPDRASWDAEKESAR